MATNQNITFADLEGDVHNLANMAKLAADAR
jgi:hypothetical protein